MGGVQQQGRLSDVGAPRGQQSAHSDLQDPVQHHLPLRHLGDGRRSDHKALASSTLLNSKRLFYWET